VPGTNYSNLWPDNNTVLLCQQRPLLVSAFGIEFLSENMATAAQALPLSRARSLDADNMTERDYDFRLLHGRRLRGSGWRGLVALALLLTANVTAVWLLGNAVRMLW
jgi:hypothetical protein